MDITTTSGTFIANGFVVHNCGPTGQLFNKALNETGTSRTKVWVGNSTLCLPTKNDEKLKHQAAVACRGRLEIELAMFPGRPVLALGGVAAKSLVGELTKLPITEIAGAHFELDTDGSGVRSVIPTVHPAAILRSSHDGDKGPEKTGSHVADLAYWSLKWDILKVRALGDGRDIRLQMRLGEEIFIELEDPERARGMVLDILDEAKECGRLTVDYETYVDDPQRNNALQAFIAKIRFLGLAAKGRAISVLWKLLDKKTIDAYAAVLADPTVTKAYHNGGVYDRCVDQNQWYGFKHAGPFEDTLFGQHAAWPGAKKKLQHVACQFRAIEPWKSEFRDSGDTLEEEAVYNAKDALATDATVGPLNFWIKKNRVERVYDLDRAKATFAAQMHLHGYYVCPDVNSEIKRRLTSVIDEANGVMLAKYEELKERVHMKLASEQAKGQRKADPDSYPDRVKVRLEELEKKIAKEKFDFRPSNDWHAVALLKACGVPLWQTTPGGRTATGGDVLEKFAHYPEVDELIRLRSNEQLLETFIIRMFEWVWQPSAKEWRPPHVQDDGRCHPLWSPTQISGRFGSKDPASSNWSNGDETNKDPRKRLPNTRRQLIAPPGRGIVAFDLAQLEARLMAVQSGDPFLCSIFADGKDIHHEFGIGVFPRMATMDKTDPEYSRLRDLTKRFEYGALYNGSDATVHKALVSDEPALAGPKGLQMVSEAIRKMKQMVGGMIAWQQRLLRETSQPPYTLRCYLTDRMRVFPLGNPPATDVANNPNQFAGAGIIDMGLVRMLPRLEKYNGTAFPILHQHDAIYFECREDDMMPLARDVQDSFATSVIAADGVTEIEFPIEVKIGFAYHSEPKQKMKDKFPELIWPVGRPGLTQVKL